MFYPGAAGMFFGNSRTAPKITWLGIYGGIPVLDIGPARSDRIIVAILYSENDRGGGFNSGSINGIPVTNVTQNVSRDVCNLTYCVVPNGTQITSASFDQYGLYAVSLYLITGLSHTGVYSSAWGPGSVAGGTQTTTLNTPPSDYGAVINFTYSGGWGGHGPNYTMNGSGAWDTGSPVFDNSGNRGGGGNPTWSSSHGISNPSNGNSISITNGADTAGLSAFTIVFF